jgi:hypothetical protein
MIFKSENEHAQLKRHLESSIENLKIVIDNIKLLLINQIHDHTIALDDAKLRYSTHLRKSIFQQLFAFVTILAYLHGIFIISSQLLSHIDISVASSINRQFREYIDHSRTIINNQAFITRLFSSLSFSQQLIASIYHQSNFLLISALTSVIVDINHDEAKAC